MCQCGYVSQPADSNLCGAYAMVYWMKKRRKDRYDHDVAQILYDAFQFKGKDFRDGNVRSELEGYCNPVRMMQWLGKMEVECQFMLGTDWRIRNIYDSLNVPTGIRVSEDEFSLASDGQVGLEVVTNLQGGLHYLYAYRDNQVLKVIDPGDGQVHDRDQLVKEISSHDGRPYTETSAGIVIN